MPRESVRPGRRRASVRDADGWQTVFPAAGPYLDGDLVEWGSITKGLVGTAAAIRLPLDREVRLLAPRFPHADFTVRDLVEHTSGLPRLPIGMGLVPFRDAYGRTVGKGLRPAEVVRLDEPGTARYSNLGYAVLGELLGDVDGAWFETVRRHVLDPAGITTATADPPEHARVVPERFGRTVTPWRLAGSPYAAAGGIWSTFEDLCRYADWALADPDDHVRTIAWRQQGETTWINGQVRASGVAIVSARGVTAVVHALAQRPFAADRAATALVRRHLERGRVLATPDGLREASS